MHLELFGLTSERARYVPQGDEALIVVDLYDGAYGLTLRFDTQRLEALAEIGGLFSRLAEHPMEELHLASREGFVLTDSLADVVVIAGEQRRINVVREAARTILKWQQPSPDWEYVHGLIDGLIDLGRQGRSGHQYLTEEGSEVLVELTYRE